MHEIAFAKSLLRDLEPLLDKKRGVSEVVIELGELVGIEDDHLIDGLRSQSNFNFRVIEKSSLIRCPCGYEGPAKIIERLHDKVIWSCPWCDEPNEAMEILEGDKIKISKIVYK